MINQKQLSPPGELLESGFADLLHNQACLLAVHLQYWSPEPVLQFSAPPTTDPQLIRRAGALVHQALTEQRSASRSLPGGTEIVAEPVVTARGGIAGFIVAIRGAPKPIARHTPSPDQGGKGSRGPGADPPRAAGISGTVRIVPETGALSKGALHVTLRGLAQVLGRQLDLMQRTADQAVELASLRSEQGLLHQISTRLADPGDARQTIEYILQQGCSSTGSEIAILQMPDARTPLAVRNPFVVVPQLNLTAKHLRQMAAQLWWGLGGWRQPSLHGPAEEILGDALALADPLQLAVTRLIHEQPKAGFLAFLRPGHQAFGAHGLRLIDSLARQVSLTVKSAELHENVGGFLMSTVKALVSAIETKDRYTSGHSARVNLLAMLLGKQLGLPADELESLKWASILHDVGKIGMPEAILHKPGRLTSQEYEVVRQHPWRGYEVLGHIGQLRAARMAVLYHHERLDGRGYPLGLSGSAIPLAARIIAVADTFDALTSNRPYREAWNEDEAHQEILRVSGTQFDPVVVEAFSEMVPFIREHRIMLESARRTA